MHGVMLDNVRSFHRVDDGDASWIEGNVLGIELAICSADDLAKMELPNDVLVDIDIDYFVTVPGDRIGTSPREMVGLVRSMDPECVTITRSVQSGFTPLRYRFIADWIAAELTPLPDLANHFERLLRIDQQLQSGNRDTAYAAIELELQSLPDCAASHYFASLASEAADPSRHYLESAAALCADYRIDALLAAAEILARGVMPSNDELAVMTEAVLAPVKHAADRHAALTAIALGLVWCDRGKVEYSVACYHAAKSVFDAHPELAIKIAKLCLHRSDELQRHVETFAEVALADDRSRALAHYILAAVRLRKGEFASAVALLNEVTRHTPMWDVARVLLANAMLVQGD